MRADFAEYAVCRQSESIGEETAMRIRQATRAGAIEMRSYDRDAVRTSAGNAVWYW